MNISQSNNCSNFPSQSEELCLVCNDISTGYHYGTPSCNGCKTFFRRTIMKKQTFICQYSGNCFIDKSVRCACRHCRFKKCLSVGMRKEAIQQNRDPIGYTKRTRRYPIIKSNSEKDLSSFNNTTNDASEFTNLTRDYQNLPQLSPNEINMEQAQEDNLMKTIMQAETYVHAIRKLKNIPNSKTVCEILIKPSILNDQEFLKNLLKMPAHSFNVLRRATHSDYQYWHERDWIIMIELAKCIPAFNMLELSDQMALLRHSAITYPSLLQCFYTPDFGPDTIVFPNGAFFDRTLEPDRPTGFQRKKFKTLDNLLNPFRRMNIDINEFSAIKAIFFLNPDADDLSNKVKLISNSRSAISNALYRYMVFKRGSEEAADRFAKLLLLGTVIATIAVEAKEAVVVAEFFEQVHFSSFAKELLLENSFDCSDPLHSKTPHLSELFSEQISKNKK